MAHLESRELKPGADKLQRKGQVSWTWLFTFNLCTP